MNASEASVAENFVLAPISIALSFNLTISSPVAPDIAFTFERLCSSEAEVLTTATPAATIGVVTFKVMSLPIVDIPLLTPFKALATPLVPSLNPLVAVIACLKPIVNLDVFKSK